MVAPQMYWCMTLSLIFFKLIQIMTQPLHVAEFSIIDYVVFIVLLIASLAIGVYYGVRGNKTTDEFLLAGRSMSPGPVALSLIATYISSIALLGENK